MRRLQNKRAATILEPLQLCQDQEGVKAERLQEKLEADTIASAKT